MIDPTNVFGSVFKLDASKLLKKLLLISVPHCVLLRAIYTFGVQKYKWKTEAPYLRVLVVRKRRRIRTSIECQ